jgi:hypothetical protein
VLCGVVLQGPNSIVEDAMRSSRMAVTLLLGTLAFSPGLAAAEGGAHSLEQLVVEMAHSPGDHAALAAHYRAKAAEERAEAKQHESMARTYTGGKFFQRSAMQTHCKKIAADKTNAAAEFEALAKLHDEEAKKAK